MIPTRMPQYSIHRKSAPPFFVRWEELMGWFIIPRLGEEIEWGLYEQNHGDLMELCQMTVIGKASVHEIEGAEILAHESIFGQSRTERSHELIAQLTDDYSRILAHAWMRDGVHQFVTFLDGDAFGAWAYGEDNLGNKIDLRPKGLISREGNTLSLPEDTNVLDVVGRYQVNIEGKTYDTICVIDFGTYDDGVLIEQFLDSKGRTILWRRYNRDDLNLSFYGTPWSERFPQNDRIIANGVTYVNWYDSITDYIYR